VNSGASVLCMTVLQIGKVSALGWKRALVQSNRVVLGKGGDLNGACRVGEVSPWFESCFLMFRR
jgi:hypothetical protein